MKRFHIITLTLASVAAIGMTGCAETRAEKGALIGAGGGALLGQAIGHDTKSTMIGAALGGSGDRGLSGQRTPQQKILP